MGNIIAGIIGLIMQWFIVVPVIIFFVFFVPQILFVWFIVVGHAV